MKLYEVNSDGCLELSSEIYNGDIDNYHLLKSYDVKLINKNYTDQINNSKYFVKYFDTYCYYDNNYNNYYNNTHNYCVRINDEVISNDNIFVVNNNYLLKNQYIPVLSSTIKRNQNINIKFTYDTINNIDNYIMSTYENIHKIYINKETKMYYCKCSNKYLIRPCSNCYVTTIAYHNYDRSYYNSIFDNHIKYRIGLEIEKEDYINLYSETAYEVLENYQVQKTRDGSLSNAGYELVTPILNLDNLNHITEYLNKFKHLINGRVTTRCGTHINISVKNYTGEETFNKYLKYYEPLLLALNNNRIENRYCKVYKDKNLYITADTKYKAFNVKSNYVEIRIFKATNNINLLLKNIKLLNFIVKNKINDYRELIPMIYSKNVSEILNLNDQSREKLLGDVRYLTAVYC